MAQKAASALGILELSSRWLALTVVHGRSRPLPLLTVAEMPPKAGGDWSVSY